MTNDEPKIGQTFDEIPEPRAYDIPKSRSPTEAMLEKNIGKWVLVKLPAGAGRRNNPTSYKNGKWVKERIKNGYNVEFVSREDHIYGRITKK